MKRFLPGWMGGCVAAMLTIGCLLGASVPAFAEVPAAERSDRLTRALDEYAAALAETDRDARLAGFARAEQGFAWLVADGIENAALYTNLGNAALQAAHPGRAVLAYHRALRLDPNASTARQNLAHVRTLLPSWVPRPEASEGAQALLFYRALPPAQRTLIAAACFSFAALCFAISVRRSEGAWRGFGVLAGIAWLALLASVLFDERSADQNLAVITAEETLARSADSSLAPLALPDPLPEGVEVERLETRAEWARVRLANGRDVWVRSSSVTRVAD